MSYGVGHRHGLGPELLWLWCRLAAAALIRPSLRPSIYATDAALKSKKKKERERERRRERDDKWKLSMVCKLTVLSRKVDSKVEWKKTAQRNPSRIIPWSQIIREGVDSGPKWNPACMVLSFPGIAPGRKIDMSLARVWNSFICLGQSLQLPELQP